MQILLCLSQSIATGCIDGRLKLLKLFQIATRTEHEHATVPVIISTSDIVSGSGLIRFLNEAAYAITSVTDRFAFLNVSVTSFGVRWHNSKSDQFALFCQCQSCIHGVMKCGHILNKMVCRQNEQYRIICLLNCLEGSQRDSRRGVPSHWLQQDFCFFHT